MTDDRVEAGRPIVVGVDGSEYGLAAVELAADEAIRRRLPLEIVHAVVPPLASQPPGLLPVPIPAADSVVHERAGQMLHDVEAQVRAARPDLIVTGRLRDGDPGAVLTEASQTATLVVVGHRGIGGFAGLLTGSVGTQLANHAGCPVIIVRGAADPEAPVVVGLDGSEGSRRAAEFAAEAAGWYQVPLVVLFAGPAQTGWQPEQAQAGQPPPRPPDAVTDAVAALTDRFPQVSIRPEVRPHLPAHETLVAASAAARLVVVGSRGHGGFHGLLLGSVSQALIHHAACPVAVVGPAVD